ncbi:hypothetical protein FB566_0714 [Stackebrandtia endophytica]|uniref:Uncharacterized protein n=2 Tax=Stackebrandtia endophytica TaxID=1496996 RepID=A0A543ARK9_9ACTN|nr:hypothetical protein FB566_0714 [Stackebrandtia endophytica]
MHWPLEPTFNAVAGLFIDAIEDVSTIAERREQLTTMAQHPSLTDEAILIRWSRLSWEARVYYGKIRRLAEDDDYRAPAAEPAHRHSGIGHCMSTAAISIMLR